MRVGLVPAVQERVLEPAAEAGAPGNGTEPRDREQHEKPKEAENDLTAMSDKKDLFAVNRLKEEGVAEATASRLVAERGAERCLSHAEALVAP